MAASGNQSLGDDLQALGKTINACKKINEIGTVISKAKEDLKSVKNKADAINVTLTSLQEFRKTIDDCIRITNSLNRHIEDINQEHSICLKNLKKVANAGKLSNEDVEGISNSLSTLVESFEKFGVSLGNFIERIKELQKVTEKVNDEATRKGKKVREEASSTRSEAEWMSIGEWSVKIASIGLITWSSDFQDSVNAKNEKYEKADKLDKIFEKFEKAQQQLDIAVRMIDMVADNVRDRPKKLTKEVIQIIRSVLLQYQKIAKAQQQVLERENTIQEKDQEIERMRKQMEEMERNQGK